MVEIVTKHSVAVKVGVNCVSVETIRINTGRLLRRTHFFLKKLKNRQNKQTLKMRVRLKTNLTQWSINMLKNLPWNVMVPSTWSVHWWGEKAQVYPIPAHVSGLSLTNRQYQRLGRFSLLRLSTARPAHWLMKLSCYHYHFFIKQAWRWSGVGVASSLFVFSQVTWKR